MTEAAASSLLKPTPWDQAVFGMPTWELQEYTPAALEAAANTPGHHTIKVDPLADKRLLEQAGFYYCDTLLETRCAAGQLRPALHPDASLRANPDAAALLAICHGAFAHGRFHRDFNLPVAASDLRYDNWLRQLLEAGQVDGLLWQGELAGFIGRSKDSFVLHATAAAFRGRGLAKYWWTLAAQQQFARGAAQVSSSISASNLAVLNLYASLGFSFRHPQDIYHKLVP